MATKPKSIRVRAPKSPQTKSARRAKRATTAASKVELRRCPFCNGKPHFTGKIKAGTLAIRCERCDAMTARGRYVGVAMRRWNARTKAA